MRFFLMMSQTKDDDVSIWWKMSWSASKRANENWKWIIYTLIKALEDLFPTWLNWIRALVMQFSYLFHFLASNVHLTHFNGKDRKTCGGNCVHHSKSHYHIYQAKYTSSSITFAWRWTCKSSLVGHNKMLVATFMFALPGQSYNNLYLWLDCLTAKFMFSMFTRMFFTFTMDIQLFNKLLNMRAS